MAFLKNLTFFAFLFLAFTACNNDDDIVIEDSSVPTGQFTVTRSGSLVAENGTPTAGTVQIGTDEDGESFLYFDSNFVTELGTGTVSIYLSTSSTFMPDPANGNPNLKVVGAVAKNGEMYVKLASAVESKFTHLILWCGTANIPFGNAQLN